LPLTIVQDSSPSLKSGFGHRFLLSSEFKANPLRVIMKRINPRRQRRKEEGGIIFP